MVIKKFQAETEEAAILKAKEEFGKDAIVMNIKMIKPRGIQKFFRKPSVEITAAIDEEVNYNSGEHMLSKMQEIQKNLEEEKQNALKQEEQKKQEEQEKREKLLKENNVITKENEEAEKNMVAIEDRLNNLQQMLEKQMQSEEKENKQEEEMEKMQETSKSDACIRLIREQLINNEVEEQYADVILNEIKNTIKKDAAIDHVLASIYQKIVLKLGQSNVLEGNDKTKKYVFFIGPTGVGKTTTIAKIASDLKLHKKAKVALITSDTYRIAAVEQLRTYANILGIPLKVIYTEEEMRKAKEEYEDFDVVLIDTAGRSHKNEQQKEDVEKLIRAIPEEERTIYLVLSATTKYKDLVKITDAYSSIAAYNLIFTKLDETCCIGNILNIKMLTDAPLSYVTSGQTVPDDIERINAQKIAKQLLGGQ